MPKTTVANTPSYIQSLVMPTAKRQTGRKVWSIDLDNVWRPFFTATNVTGDTAIQPQALGAPLRLAYEKSGEVRFSQSGKPVIKVASELSEAIRNVRDNFTANLLNFAGEVIAERGEDYKAQIQLCAKAGKPIIQHDKAELQKAIKALAEAEAEAVLKARIEAIPEPEAERVPEPVNA